ncbi:MAG: UvrD-helicase domain-containing protein [Thermogutta sp.]
MKDSTNRSHPRHLLIRASAGSGKTFQLIHGLARLLLSGRPVESILATTFSRKAAREILDRLLGRLLSAAQRPEQARDLAKVVGTTLGPNDCFELLRELVDRLDRINICTLDSFFVRVAQRFRLELDLPWTWTILDEEADRRLRLRAISEMLAAEQSTDAADWMRLLTKGQAVRSVTDQLLELVYQLYDLVFLESEEAAWSVIPAAKELSEKELQSHLRVLDGLASWYADRPGSKPDGRVVNALIAGAEKARAGDWEKFLTTGIAKAVADGTGIYYRKPIDDELLEAYRPVVEHAQAVLRNRIRRQTATIFHMLREFHACYETAKRRRGGVTFADVTRHVRDGLAASWRTSPLPGFRLDGTVEHLLLDEFQDTSMPQWEALRPLVEHIRSGKEGTFFCVGDVKQSVYGWRGSEPAIIENLPNEIPELATMPLDVSYRSSPVVIETVNRVFEPLPRNAAFAAASNSDERDIPRQAAEVFAAAFQSHGTAREELDGYCALMSKEAHPVARPRDDAEEADDDVPEEISPESSRAVQLIAQLHRDYPELEIGVLFRKKDAIPPLLSGLRRLGIPVSEEAGNPLDLAPGVRVLLSLLRLADHPGDKAAAFHVAHSPLAETIGWQSYSRRSSAEQAEARRELSLRLRTQIGLRGYGPVIFDYAKSLLPFSAVEDLPRLERLALLAYAYETRDRSRVDDFVRWIESRREAEPSQGVVRLMTIHASKGLQFPIVVLPDLDQRLEGQPPNVAADRSDSGGKYDWVCAWTDRKLREVGVLPEGFAERFDRTRLRVIRESLCLLYVAMTRAVHALYMLINPSRDHERTLPLTWAGILRAALLSPNEDGAPPAFQRVLPDEVLWEHGKRAWRPPSAPPSEERLTPESTGEPIRFTGKPRTPRAVHWLSPHALEGRDRPLRDLFRRPPQRALDEGSILHLWFSQIDWLEDGVPDDRVLHDLAAGDFSANPQLTADLSRLLAEFRRLLEAKELRSLLSRKTPDAFLPPRIARRFPSLDGVDWVVWKERPFAIFLDDGTFCRGQFDRVTVAYRSGKPILAQVVDYKTDKVVHAESTAEETDPRFSLVARAAFYRPQLEKYREAAACLLSLPADRVAATLAFVYAGKVLAVEDAGDER